MGDCAFAGARGCPTLDDRGTVGGFVFGLVTVFKKTWSSLTAPVYALCEGLVLGGISALLEQTYTGIAIQAMGLTFGVTAVMLVLYTVRRGPRDAQIYPRRDGGDGRYFPRLYGGPRIGLFGRHVPLLNSSGPLGIGISVVIVIIAALNLILNFDFVEKGVHAQAPKYMEWYGAFGIMVTLVWMYVEILRLLSKMRERR